MWNYYFDDIGLPLTLVHQKKTLVFELFFLFGNGFDTSNVIMVSYEELPIIPVLIIVKWENDAYGMSF